MLDWTRMIMMMSFNCVLNYSYFAEYLSVGRCFFKDDGENEMVQCQKYDHNKERNNA